MPPIPFFIVDVFAEEKYAGNQLAVFTEAASLSGADMQRLAKEMHFSESTFLLSSELRDGGYDVRIFTPEAEVPFAGHPTLGTAFVIQQEILKARVDTVTLNLPVRPIPVTFRSIRVTGNMRLVLRFDGGEAVDVDLVDYH